MIASTLLSVISSIAEFHVKFNVNIIVLCVVVSSILIIASPDISSMNGASTLISFCPFGFSNMHSFGKMCKDLFRKLKQQSHEFITPSSSNIFLIPRIRSMFLWILDTSVYILNLCPCMSIVIRIMYKMLKNYPFPT